MVKVQKFSDLAFDRMATDVSKFTNPNMPILELNSRDLLEICLMDNILGPWSGENNKHIRYVITNIARKIDGSIEDYERGRSKAYEFVEGDRSNTILPYFRVLGCFESCVSSTWQALDIVRNLGEEKIFENGSGSAFERLHGIYTQGIKHSSGRFSGVNNIEMPTSVWLTNKGISCVSGHSLEFNELTEMIADNCELLISFRKKSQAKYLQGVQPLDT